MLKDKKTKYRQVRLSIPIDQALILEIEAVKANMTFSAYCVHLLTNMENKRSKHLLNEIYEMLHDLHSEKFETGD